MKYFVAPSYQNMEMVKVDEDARKALVKGICPRCSGLGIFATRVENGRPVPTPVDGGVCYQCGGEGMIQKWVKAYTEDEYEKYVQAQSRAKEKKEQAKQAHITEMKLKSEENKKEKLAAEGYDPENPTIYLVGGGNTYVIKEQLKELGCRFNPSFGWFAKQEIEVPEGYKLVSIKFFDCYEWEPVNQQFWLKDAAKETAAAAIATLQPKSLSEYIGEVKERVRDLEVTLTGARSFDGAYGTTFIYTFKQGENILVWMTSSCKDVEVGDKFLLTGTIKKHEEYKGTKQTYLSRCILKEAA